VIATASAVAFVTVAIAALLNLWRILKGPDILDRVLGLDTLVINTIALIILAGMAFGTPVYFEAALLFAMVGFLSTVAFCKYLLRGNVIE
jgi:multicomponent K+:H+ antiporter subunit F